MAEIQAPSIANLAGTGPIDLEFQVAAKSWGLGNSGASISDSFNVASLTDNGTGDYTWSYTNNMANAANAYAGASDAAARISAFANIAVGSVDQYINSDTGSANDTGHFFNVIGDLA